MLSLDRSLIPPFPHSPIRSRETVADHINEMEAVREREGYDQWLLWIAVLLLGVGTAVVLDTSFARDFQSSATGHDAFYTFKRQLMWLVPATVSLCVGMRLPYWTLRKYWLIGA